MFCIGAVGDNIHREAGAAQPIAKPAAQLWIIFHQQ
jgi:hypothetical protein